MKKQIVIILILSAILVSSCEIAVDREIGRCDLTEAQMQIIPYKMGQVVSFIDGAGRTVDLTITQNELGWNYDGMASSFHEEYLAYRTKFVALKSQTNNLEIYLHIFAGSSLSGYDNCSLRIGRKSSSGGAMLYYDTEGIFLSGIGSTLFHDSLKINDSVYYNVIEQASIYDTISKQTLTHLFYNKTHGILHITNGEISLTLKS